MEFKTIRPCKMFDEIFSVQLTKDQRPDDIEESERIKECGGRIKRSIDEQGNRIGPYRVWEAEINTPGLAMTRSIGDTVGKTIGVIAKPIITIHPIDLIHDMFIVIASDGLWNCMDNEDVINFGEYYRSLACKEVKKHKDANANISNSIISQLLCEEARARWLRIVEKDDVMIDDISCVIVEFNGKVERPKLAKIQKFYTNSSKAREEEEAKANEYAKLPTIRETMIKDPRRGSHAVKE